MQKFHTYFPLGTAGTIVDSIKREDLSSNQNSFFGISIVG